MHAMLRAWLVYERQRPRRLGSYLAAWAIVDLIRSHPDISVAENNC